MKIVIADKQEIFRLGLITIINQKFKSTTISEITNKDDLQTVLTSEQPELILIDYEQVTDFELKDIATLKSASSSTKIILITNNETEEDIFKALEMGIDGYLLKTTNVHEIHSAIESVSNGGKHYCSKVIDTLYNKHITKTVQKIDEAEYSDLTPKEIEIIKLIVEGKITKEIADMLFISIHTVNTHRKNIFKKIAVKNSSELIMFAIKKGIVDTTEYYI